MHRDPATKQGVIIHRLGLSLATEESYDCELMHCTCCSIFLLLSGERVRSPLMTAWKRLFETIYGQRQSSLVLANLFCLHPTIKTLATDN